MSSTSSEEVEESAVEHDVRGRILSQFMDYIDTDVLGTLDPNEMMEVFPGIRRRVNILKNLQMETANIEAKFFTEVYALHCKYDKLYAPIYDKRCQVITGAYEVTAEEAQSPSNDEGENLESQEKNSAKVEEEKDSDTDDDESNFVGIPNFWLTIFQSVNFLSDMVESHDEPILSHLEDIRVEGFENPMRFILSFYFSPNKYFTNSVLTKEYFLKCEPDPDDLFNFEGVEIYKSKGCIINWNKGMNITVKTLMKKQRHKTLNVVRSVVRTVENDSFFNFFTPPEVPENIDEIDYDLDQLLKTDFEVGRFFKEKVVPKAVLLYLGELNDGDDEWENYLDDTSEDQTLSDNEKDDEVAKDENCEQK